MNTGLNRPEASRERSVGPQTGDGSSGLVSDHLCVEYHWARRTVPALSAWPSARPPETSLSLGKSTLAEKANPRPVHLARAGRIIVLRNSGQPGGGRDANLKLNLPKVRLPGKGAPSPQFGEGGCPFEPGQVRGIHCTAGAVGIPINSISQTSELFRVREARCRPAQLPPLACQALRFARVFLQEEDSPVSATNLRTHRPHHFRGSTRSGRIGTRLD